MDYKEVVKMLNWMVKNAKMSGTDARLLVMMATEASYKTGDYASGYGEMADELKLSKTSVIASVNRLEEIGAIKMVEKPTGKRPSVYKIRSVEDLCLIHEKEEVNPAWQEWRAKAKDLFGEFEKKLESIADGCEECFKDDGEEMCDRHKEVEKRLMDSKEGKEMRIWESDHPKPPFKIKVVEFIK